MLASSYQVNTEQTQGAVFGATTSYAALSVDLPEDTPEPHFRSVSNDCPLADAATCAALNSAPLAPCPPGRVQFSYFVSCTLEADLDGFCKPVNCSTPTEPAVYVTSAQSGVPQAFSQIKPFFVLVPDACTGLTITLSPTENVVFPYPISWTMASPTGAGDLFTFLWNLLDAEPIFLCPDEANAAVLVPFPLPPYFGRGWWLFYPTLAGGATINASFTVNYFSVSSPVPIPAPQPVCTHSSTHGCLADATFGAGSWQYYFAANPFGFPTPNPSANDALLYEYPLDQYPGGMCPPAVAISAQTSLATLSAANRVELFASLDTPYPTNSSMTSYFDGDSGAATSVLRVRVQLVLSFDPSQNCSGRTLYIAVKCQVPIMRVRVRQHGLALQSHLLSDHPELTRHRSWQRSPQLGWLHLRCPVLLPSGVRDSRWFAPGRLMYGAPTAHEYPFVLNTFLLEATALWDNYELEVTKMNLPWGVGRVLPRRLAAAVPLVSPTDGSRMDELAWSQCEIHVRGLVDGPGLDAKPLQIPPEVLGNTAGYDPRPLADSCNTQRYFEALNVITELYELVTNSTETEASQAPAARWWLMGLMSVMFSPDVQACWLAIQRDLMVIGNLSSGPQLVDVCQYRDVPACCVAVEQPAPFQQLPLRGSDTLSSSCSDERSSYACLRSFVVDSVEAFQPSVQAQCNTLLDDGVNIGAVITGCQLDVLGAPAYDGVSCWTDADCAEAIVDATCNIVTGKCMATLAQRDSALLACFDRELPSQLRYATLTAFGLPLSGSLTDLLVSPPAELVGPQCRDSAGAYDSRLLTLWRRGPSSSTSGDSRVGRISLDDAFTVGIGECALFGFMEGLAPIFPTPAHCPLSATNTPIPSFSYVPEHTCSTLERCNWVAPDCTVVEGATDQPLSVADVTTFGDGGASRQPLCAASCRGDGSGRCVWCPDPTAPGSPPCFDITDPTDSRPNRTFTDLHASAGACAGGLACVSRGLVMPAAASASAPCAGLGTCTTPCWDKVCREQTLRATGACVIYGLGASGTCVATGAKWQPTWRRSQFCVLGNVSDWASCAAVQDELIALATVGNSLPAAAVGWEDPTACSALTDDECEQCEWLANIVSPWTPSGGTASCPTAQLVPVPFVLNASLVQAGPQSASQMFVRCALQQQERVCADQAECESAGRSCSDREITRQRLQWSRTPLLPYMCVVPKNGEAYPCGNAVSVATIQTPFGPVAVPSFTFSDGCAILRSDIYAEQDPLMCQGIWPGATWRRLSSNEAECESDTVCIEPPLPAPARRFVETLEYRIASYSSAEQLARTLRSASDCANTCQATVVPAFEWSVGEWIAARPAPLSWLASPGVVPYTSWEVGLQWSDTIRSFIRDPFGVAASSSVQAYAACSFPFLLRSTGETMERAACHLDDSLDPNFDFESYFHFVDVFGAISSAGIVCSNATSNIIVPSGSSISFDEDEFVEGFNGCSRVKLSSFSTAAFENPPAKTNWNIFSRTIGSSRLKNYEAVLVPLQNRHLFINIDRTGGGQILGPGISMNALDELSVTHLHLCLSPTLVVSRSRRQANNMTSQQVYELLLANRLRNHYTVVDVGRLDGGFAVEPMGLAAEVVLSPNGDICVPLRGDSLRAFLREKRVLYPILRAHSPTRDGFGWSVGESFTLVSVGCLFLLSAWLMVMLQFRVVLLWMTMLDLPLLRWSSFVSFGIRSLYCFLLLGDALDPFSVGALVLIVIPLISSLTGVGSLVCFWVSLAHFRRVTSRFHQRIYWLGSLISLCVFTVAPAVLVAAIIGVGRPSTDICEERWSQTDSVAFEAIVITLLVLIMVMSVAAIVLLLGYAIYLFQIVASFKVAQGIPLLGVACAMAISLLCSSLITVMGLVVSSEEASGSVHVLWALMLVELGFSLPVNLFQVSQLKSNVIRR